jgi:SpoU rRNA methylase family enzyme
MSVTLQTHTGSAISINDLIYGINTAMQALVTKIIHAQADCQIEVMIDHQLDDKVELTRADIVKNLAPIKELSRDMIEDVIETLRCSMHSALSKAEINLEVRGMSFDGGGQVSDVDANLYVTYKV